MGSRARLILLLWYRAAIISFLACFFGLSIAYPQPASTLAAVGSLPELSGTAIEYFYRPADGLIVTDTLLRYGVVPTIVRSEKPRTDKSNVITCSADVSAAAI